MAIPPAPWAANFNVWLLFQWRIFFLLSSLNFSAIWGHFLLSYRLLPWKRDRPPPRYNLLEACRIAVKAPVWVSLNILSKLAIAQNDGDALHQKCGFRQHELSRGWSCEHFWSTVSGLNMSGTLLKTKDYSPSPLAVKRSSEGQHAKTPSLDWAPPSIRASPLSIKGANCFLCYWPKGETWAITQQTGEQRGWKDTELCTFQGHQVKQLYWSIKWPCQGMSSWYGAAKSTESKILWLLYMPPAHSHSLLLG